MFETILSILSSGGIGAVVGLIGSFATKYVEFKVLDRKLRNEKELAEIRIRELELEQSHALALADKQIDIAQAEGAIQQDIAAMDAFKESQREVSIKYGTWIDNLRGAMRPIITIFLMIVSVYLTWKVWLIVDGLGGMERKDVFSLFKYLIESSVFLTITAVTWWFGTRPSEWVKGRTP